MMKRLYLLLSFLTLAFFLQAAGSPELLAAKDRIVAVVNGEVITLKQLDQRVNTILKTRQGASMSRDTLRPQVLESLIDQELINQAAKAKGVFVTESDVSLALESIKQENNLTDAQFQSSLAQSGTTMAAFREDLRVELLRNRVLGAQVMSKIVVTDSEVRAFLRGEGPDLGMGVPGNDKRPVRMIFLAMDPNNKTKTLSEAMSIKREIENGMSFADAAAKYSQGPGRDNGGDSGEGVTVDKLPPPIQAALAQKKSGEPLEPLEAGGNAMIIMSAVGDPPSAAPVSAPASKKRKKGKDDPNEFSAEAMEIGRRQLERYKMQQRFVEWVNDLKRKAIIRNNL